GRGARVVNDTVGTSPKGGDDANSNCFLCRGRSRRAWPRRQSQPAWWQPDWHDITDARSRVEMVATATRNRPRRERFRGAHQPHQFGSREVANERLTSGSAESRTSVASAASQYR